MLNFCDFIQVFVFTRNHHLKPKIFVSSIQMYEAYENCRQGSDKP